jgi:hypothetical protein
MSKKRFKFTVERSKWLRGNPQTSVLLDGDTGKMCCVGFLSRACGLEKRTISEQGTLSELANRGGSSAKAVSRRKVLAQFLKDLKGRAWRSAKYANSNVAQEIYEANDMRHAGDGAIEARLRSLFAQLDIDVEFVP